MILELLIALLIGILVGTFTGLAPGIHINLIAALLVSSLSFFSAVPPLALVAFIVAMSLTHVLIDIIPTIFLNVPEEDTFLALLPSQQLLLEGRGYEAIVLTLFGSLLGLALLAPITLLYLIALPSLYSSLAAFLPYLLLFLSLYIIFRDARPLLAAFVFALAALLGLLTFNLPVNEPLLPLLTGLFGCSSLLLALRAPPKLKRQQLLPLSACTPTKRELTRATLASLLAAPLCSFLPGISSSHAATLGSECIEQNNRSFLLLLGAINVLIMSLSFVVVFSIARARSGSAAAVQEILHSLSLSHLFLMLFVVTLTIALVFPLALLLARSAMALFNALPYRSLTLSALVLLSLLSLLFSGWLGLLILATAASIGIVCISAGVRRINLMASLIVPAALFYLTR